MKPFFKFLFIMAAILLASAVLAPILFDYLPFKFEKIFNRLVMIFTLAAVLIFVRMRHFAFAQYGLIFKKGSLPQALAGFSSGFFVLVGVTFTGFILGHAVWSRPELSVPAFGIRVLGDLGAALLIGLIEEFFFRGFVFVSLRDRFAWGVGGSLLATNFFYSLTHFVSIKKPYIGPDPTFYDSLRWMGAPFASFAHWQEFWPAALGLFLFGLILNDLAIRTRSLAASIGLHAGCVFFVKIDGLFVDFLDNHILWLGSKKLYDGVVGWLFLIILFIGLRLWIRNGQER